jgi:eukaryotic-like serine/threonine-protein kinase
MSNERQCDRCGRPLNGAASDGICPACVAGLGQAPWLAESATQVTGAARRHPVSRSERHETTGSIGPVIRQFGDYELLEEIAHGGMGTVYRARQTSLNRPVALKLISGGAVASAEQVKRFQAEAEVAASLTHPNIVPIHEIGQHVGQHYFSMGLVEGPSLRKRLHGRPMPTREAVSLVATLARAVHYAHQRGVLHRDLKPSNIVLDREGEPHLTDFGLAKLVDQESTLTHTNAVLGTPSYMAPEQARGATKEVTTALDVYGLGAVLYESLTGSPPFAGGTSIETIRQVLDQEPRRPSLWNPHVDRDLETICLKCLEKLPEQRYASADALANDLDRWTRHEPIRARPVSTWEHTRKWLRRRPPIFFFMATAVVVSLIGGLAGILWGWNQAVTARDQALQSERDLREALEQAQQAAAQEDRVHRFNYAASMTLAQEAWEHNDVRLVRRLLDTTAEQPHRGFEWYYWQGQTRQALRTLRGHWAPVNAVAYWPDGQRIVTGSQDGTTKVWDVSSGTELLTLGAENAFFTRVTQSADGRRILTATPGPPPGRTPVRAAGVGDAPHRPEPLPHPPAIRSAAICADREWIATGSEAGTVKVWDACAGEPVLTLAAHAGAVTCLAFSSDGRWIVTTAEDRVAKVWDTSTGQQLRTLEGHTAPVTAVAVSPNNQWIVTASHDRTAKIWDALTGMPIRILEAHTAPVTTVAVSFDNRWIVTGSHDRTVTLWDAATGEELRTLAGHSGHITSVALSADSRRVVTGSLDRSVKVWDTETGKQLFTLKGHSDPVTSVAISPGGWRIVTGSEDHTANVWSASDGEGSPAYLGVSSYSDPPLPAAPGGQPLVARVQDRIVTVWDGLTGEELYTLAGHSSPITSMAEAADCFLLVTGSEDSTAKAWNLCNGEKLLTLEGHQGSVTAAAIAPGGRQIITGSADRTARIWDGSSGQLLFTLEGHKGSVTTVAIAPDGRQIVTASSLDQTARVWDPLTGKQLLLLQGHMRPITTVTFFPDGQRIVTGSADGSLRVWDARGGQSLLTLKRHTGSVASVTVSPDGQHILTRGADGTSAVFQAASAEQVEAWLAQDAAAERLRSVIETLSFRITSSEDPSASIAPRAHPTTLPPPRERIIVVP